MNCQELEALQLQAVRMLYGTYGYEQDEEAAVALLKTAAEAGHCPAMRAYGLCLGRGRGVKQDDEEADRWLRKAWQECSGEIAPRFRGEIYRRDTGELAFIDWEWQYKLSRWYAAQDQAEAQFEVGKIWEEGHLGRKSRKIAQRWYVKAGRQGHIEACYRCGVLYHEAGLRARTQDIRRKSAAEREALKLKCFKYALEWLRPPAEEGHTDAMFRLGQLEQGVDGWEWLHHAAYGGHVEATYQLACKYQSIRQGSAESGAFSDVLALLRHSHPDEAAVADMLSRVSLPDSIAPPGSEWLEWLHLAAKRGSRMAQYDLACELIRTGDRSEGMAWFLNSAKQDLPAAQIDLGSFLLRERNPDGLKWSMLALEKGHGAAAYDVGSAYLRGVLGPADTQKADRYFEMYIDSNRRYSWAWRHCAWQVVEEFLSARPVNYA